MYDMSREILVSTAVYMYTKVELQITHEVKELPKNHEVLLIIVFENLLNGLEVIFSKYTYIVIYVHACEHIQ